MFTMRHCWGNPDPALFAPGECEEGDVPFLAGKTVLVTGATRGLGEGIVRQLCTTEHKPARVMLLARSEAKSKVRPTGGSSGPSMLWWPLPLQQRPRAATIPEIILFQFQALHGRKGLSTQRRRRSLSRTVEVCCRRYATIWRRRASAPPPTWSA
jgi:hypothetical protein